jgi:hypothetical protein
MESYIGNPPVLTGNDGEFHVTTVWMDEITLVFKCIHNDAISRFWVPFPKRYL